MGYQTSRKAPLLAGVTPRISFQIVNEDGVGFRPDTLTISVYDVAFTPLATSRRTTVPAYGSTPLVDTIVHDRNDVDVLAQCDASGNVELTLETEDTAVDVPTGSLPTEARRRILFTWTWDSDKVGKHEVILTITPDRETVAS